MAEMAETSSLLELPIWQLECRINWDSDATRYCEKKKKQFGSALVTGLYQVGGKASPQACFFFLFYTSLNPNPFSTPHARYMSRSHENMKSTETKGQPHHTVEIGSYYSTARGLLRSDDCRLKQVRTNKLGLKLACIYYLEFEFGLWERLEGV